MAHPTNAVPVFGEMVVLTGMATMMTIDPTLRDWFRDNWVLLLVVAGFTMMGATISCLLFPASNPRLNVARVLASGFGAAVFIVIAGGLTSHANTPWFIAGVIGAFGAGGWVVYVAVIHWFAAKDNPDGRTQIVGWLTSWLKAGLVVPPAPAPNGDGKAKSGTAVVPVNRIASVPPTPHPEANRVHRDAQLGGG